MIQDEFQAQTMMMLDKLTEAQDKHFRSSKSKADSNFDVRSHGQTESAHLPPQLPKELPSRSAQNVISSSQESDSSQSSCKFPSHDRKASAAQLGSFTLGGPSPTASNDTSAVPKDASGILSGGKSNSLSFTFGNAVLTGSPVNEDPLHFEPVIQEGPEVLFSEGAKPLFESTPLTSKQTSLAGSRKPLVEEKKGTTNSLIWNTLADYSEEVLKPEQLDVKLKTQEVLLFKEKFEECQKMSKKGAKVADTNEKSSDLMAKFAPKPGSWSCSICMVSNEEHTTVCVACGAAKLSEESETTVAQAMPMSGFQVPKELTPSSAPHRVSSSLGSPFVFKMSDIETLTSCPFTFNATSKAPSGSPSLFTFGAPSSAASTQTSSVFGASSPPLGTSKPVTSQPFVFTALGVPAINSKSSQPSFPFGTSRLTGSSPFSFSATKQAENTTPSEASVFGGCANAKTAVPKDRSGIQGSKSMSQHQSHSSQSKPSFSQSKANVMTTPMKPVPVHSTQAETSAPVQPSQATTALERFLVVKSPLKGAKKPDEDCVIVYEVRASIAGREKATRLFLPPNFFSYTKHEACPGCIGCLGVSKEVAGCTSEKEDKESKAADVTTNTTENATKPSPNTSAAHVFGQSASFGQLTFSSLVQNSNAFSETQKKDSHKPFQGAGTQLFADSSEGAEGQNEDQLHFEPVIPLPEEIQVVTGEEGLEVLFSERAKLYRFDVDSGQWKERGVGEVKLLRHPTSGRGRVLMRREQIKKLCANHNITAAMKLKPNVGSDRSWVWYTSADYAEGEARPEKLAVKLKTPEIADKFKQVFDDLKELSSSEHPPETAEAEDQKKTGCELYEQFMSTFTAAPGAWTCEVCYVVNKANDSTCVACNTVKPGVQVVEPSLTTGEETASNAVVESVEPIAFQDPNKTEAPTGFVFQSPGGKGLSSAQLFTIGRVDPGENIADDEIETSPYKTSPSKQWVSPSQKPSTPSQSAQMTGTFGIGTPSKFTFSLVVSPGSPTRQPKSPSPHASPQSPESPSHLGDDGPHFEPVIPLPEKGECRTGEEGQEKLFCEHCKLFRYDRDTSQWKERGIGDIKILLNPSSGKYRVLMRREQIFKLCANHLISGDMELKPFPNSDRAWLWTTLADFSEEKAAAETLAARFKTSEIASQFKETFGKAKQSIV